MVLSKVSPNFSIFTPKLSPYQNWNGINYKSDFICDPQGRARNMSGSSYFSLKICRLSYFSYEYLWCLLCEKCRPSYSGPSKKGKNVFWSLYAPVSVLFSIFFMSKILFYIVFLAAKSSDCRHDVFVVGWNWSWWRRFFVIFLEVYRTGSFWLTRDHAFRMNSICGVMF